MAGKIVAPIPGVNQVLTIPEASNGTRPEGSVEPPPPTKPSTASASTPACGSYDYCIGIAKSLLEASQSERALARFQDASQFDESKGDPWAGMGTAYFQLAQYDDAVANWDKALQLGSSLSMSVCHAKALCGDTGTLLFKEVSFINRKGEKEFGAAPSDVTSEGAVIFNNGQAYYLQLRLAGKNYRLYYLPKVAGCHIGFVCPEPGLSQQKAFGDYVHGTLVRMAAGDFGSQPSKP